LDGDDSIQDLEDSPEQESYNVITTKSAKKKMKSRNNIEFEKTDQPDILNLNEHNEDQIENQLKDIENFQEAANRKEKELEGTG